jgi:D-lactate dehydrogenase
MNVIFFSTQLYDKAFFDLQNKTFQFDLQYLEVQLNEQTVKLAQGADAICVFVNDRVDKNVISQLAIQGVKVIALRCAGFNNVDLGAAESFKMKVVRVPAYSPYAVAEHTIAMIMTLNRKIHKAYNRVREQNFSLNGLLGFDLHDKTVGVIGTGNIGQSFCRIVNGFGCQVLAYDVKENKELMREGVHYVSLEDLFSKVDILSLHCPLNEKTRYMINDSTIKLMKRGIMLINTSRGGLIDTQTVIKGLKSGVIGSLGIDVYEQEENLFFRDLSETIIQDDIISRLMGFSNVLVTAHQGFFTQEALTQIAETTLSNLKAFENDQQLVNQVRL